VKLVYLHQYFNTPAMNGSIRSFEMARRLVDRGHQVAMVTSWRWPTEHGDWFITDESGIEVHWLPVPYDNEMSYAARLQAFFRFAGRAARRAARLDGDLVFASSTPLTIALPGVYAARRRRRPMVFEVRDLWPEMPINVGAIRNPLAKWLARRLESFAYRNARRIVALSPGMAAGVAARGYRQANIDVIPNSADLDLFHPDADGDGFRREFPNLGSRPIMLYAGTLGRINGIEYLAELAAALRLLESPVCIVVLGAGSEEGRVRTSAERLSVLDQNFFLLPPMAKQKVGVAFAAASLICSICAPIAGVENNSANKFFDGLAAGRALAVNHGGWQADLLKNHQAGIELDRDAESAARQVVDLFADPERLARMGANARRLAEAEFSRDLLARKLERTLLEALA